ncbi:hypothetical protein [Streptomyces malaysiensis]|uniref:hypothetical protein n=1 Tax=Streptomyces malaysiensis TaxID=92644 RepID=UPI00114D0CA9|nr:hypothetical protein [Streptomyces sp. SPMA113]
MPIVLPNTDQIPDGPHRRLLLAVHQLYRDAGKPGIHHTSRTIRSRNDLRDTISHEAISRILRGEVMPRRWQKLEALIQQYLDWSVDRPSPEESAMALRKIQTLWHQATDAADKTATASTVRSRPLLYPDEIVVEALKLPDDKARELLINETRRPGRELVPLVVALMPTLPEEGLRLLHLAGITYDIGDDPRIADTIAQVQRYPAETWHGHDPLRALLRNASKRSDYGVHLIKTLMKRNNTAAVENYLKTYAERTSAAGAAELVRELTKARGLHPVIDQFMRMVSEHTPRSLAREVPAQLRQVGRRREARMMAGLLDG